MTTGQSCSTACQLTRLQGTSSFRFCNCMVLSYMKLHVTSQVEQLDVSLCLAFLDSTRGFLGPEAASCPTLQRYHTLLCQPQQAGELQKLFTAVSARWGLEGYCSGI